VSAVDPSVPRPEDLGHGTALEDAWDTEWVWRALSGVIDPELGLDIVTLGLVYDVRLTDGAVVVEMTLTTPGCPASESLSAMAQYSVAQCDERARDVEVRLVWDPPWSPAMIDEGAAAALGFHVRRQ
jgi:metal-sulfur cluster biosynthetic enzyme